MEILLIYLAVILITIAVWNAFVILWKTEADSKRYSKIWHGIGLALRVLVYAVPFFMFHGFTDMIKWSLIFVSIGGVAYDFIINAIRYYYTGHPDLWYVDNKGWNAFFLKFLSPTWYWIIRGVFILVTVIILFT